MRIKTLRQVNGRTSDGRVYSAGEDAVTDVDDNDEGMVALMRALAAAGDVAIDEPEEAEEEDDEEPPPVVHTRYEDRTVLELRDLARERGLPIYGSKDDLIARLRGDGK